MMKKRLGIFLFFDKDGIADRYIEYMLKDIKTCLEHLMIIVNGEADEKAMEMFNSIADEVIVRENIGFDIAAWKQGIVEECGKDGLLKYDSLVLFNDSFFGPLYPFKDVFEEMDKRGDDYWGLSAHGTVNGSGLCPYGYRPRYIQTYFMVFEKRLLHSDDFWSFWLKQPEYKNYNELAEKFVAVLTQQFFDLGYKWSVLSDTSDLESEDRRKNFDHHSFNIYDLIANRKYPIIKRRSFYIEKETYLEYTNGGELPRSLEYIEENYDYDVSLIFEHLMRKYNPYDIKSSLCLDYVLPNHSDADDIKKGEAVVIAHLVYDELFEKYIKYLKNVPEEIDIVITTNSKEKAETLENIFRNDFGSRLTIREVQNRGRDISALLVACKDILLKYEYLCFVHDKKSVTKEFSTVGYEFDRLNWENMLGSEGYIKNIVALLKKHKYLGMLSPFAVNHGTYFKSSTNYWTICNEAVTELSDMLGIKKPDENKNLIAVGTCFWCRAKAMKILFEYPFEYETFTEEPLPADGAISHAIERILPFVAAAGGYCSGWVYNEEYARIELSALRNMFDSTIRITAECKDINNATFKRLLQSLKKIVTEISTNEAPKVEETNKIKQKIKKVMPKSLLNIYKKIKYGGN